MPKTGSKPGAGTYACTTGGTKIRLDDNSDRLPLCPKCGGTDFN